MDETRVQKLTVDLLAALSANSVHGEVAVSITETERGFEFGLLVRTVELVDITPKTVYTVKELPCPK